MNRPSKQLSAVELRIGNWVMGNKPFQVDGMQIALAESREREGFEIGWQPILLTEKWLERFGFKEFIDFGSHTGYYDKLPLCGFGYDINTQKVMIMHKGNGISHWIDIKIEYVHQLQNLYFALTGEELTIKTN